MRIIRSTFSIQSTALVECIDITEHVREQVSKSRVRDGQACVYVPHTTAGIIINHNEPFLLRDIVRMLYRTVPLEDQYAHDVFELKNSSKRSGRSNGHSHAKALLLGTSETVFVEDGAIVLAPKQSIFVVDCDGPQKRDVMVQVMGV